MDNPMSKIVEWRLWYLRTAMVASRIKTLKNIIQQRSFVSVSLRMLFLVKDCLRIETSGANSIL